MADNNKKKDHPVMEALVMVLQFGINMLVPIFLCTFAGVWIGNRTGLLWIAVPMFFVGALARGNNVYRMARRLIRKAEKSDWY